MSRKPNKPTVEQLQREVMELKAQRATAYTCASTAIEKAGVKHKMASGVLLQLTAVGGAEIIPPVMIRDGLSVETIDAIRADLKRSLDLATLKV